MKSLQLLSRSGPWFKPASSRSSRDSLWTLAADMVPLWWSQKRSPGGIVAHTVWWEIGVLMHPLGNKIMQPVLESLCLPLNVWGLPKPKYCPMSLLWPRYDPVTPYFGHFRDYNLIIMLDMIIFFIIQLLHDPAMCDRGQQPYRNSNKTDNPALWYSFNVFERRWTPLWSYFLKRCMIEDRH